MAKFGSIYLHTTTITATFPNNVSRFSWKIAGDETREPLVRRYGRLP